MQPKRQCMELPLLPVRMSQNAEEKPAWLNPNIQDLGYTCRSCEYSNVYVSTIPHDSTALIPWSNPLVLRDFSRK